MNDELISGYKCPTCGSTCERQGTIYKCTGCGNSYSDNNIDSRFLDKLNAANQRRIEDYDFEGALELCKEVLRHDPDNEEANWCALLAEKEVIYIENAKGKFTPTFIDPDKSITDSVYYYRLDLTHRRSADEIESVRREVASESKTITDYDVFISYKQHIGKKHYGNTASETPEAKWAEQLYNCLLREHNGHRLNIFFDKESLGVSNAGWEPHIYAALKSAKIMVVLASSLQNMDTPWVKNEWKRFAYYKRRGEDKTIALVGDKLDPDGLPDIALRSGQMIEVEDKKWLQKTVKRIYAAAEAVGVGKNVDHALDMANTFITKKKFGAAKREYDRILAAGPKNAAAHWGLLKCKLKALDDYDIVKNRKKIGAIDEFNDAVHYADAAQKAKYRDIKKRCESKDASGFDRPNYNRWKRATHARRVAGAILAVIVALGALGGGAYLYNLKSREYLLNFDCGEAAITQAAVKTYMGDTIPTLPAGLTISDKQYMDFAGWYTEPDCKGIQVTDDSGNALVGLESVINANDGSHVLKLYAGFKVHEYTVTFYDDDGHTILKEIKAAYGTAFEDILPDISVGDKKALTWRKEGGNSEFTGDITEDISLYVLDFGITVTYEANGGLDVPSAIVRVGDKVPLPNTTREYYGFEGWTYNDNALEYGFIAPDKSITLTAKWKRTHYSATYNANGGDEVNSEMVRVGTSPTMPFITRQYYRFLGWEYAGELLESDFVMPERNITLTARWERTHYFVTFKTEGGNAVNSAVVRLGDTLSLPTTTRMGYRFLGWFDSAGKEWESTTTLTSDVTLTAKWQANSYVVTLDAQGGSVGSSSKTVTYDSAYTLPVPTRNGYKFNGWYTAVSRSGVRITGADGKSLSNWNTAGERTLFAIWVKEYSIALDRQSCKVDNGWDPRTKGTPDQIKTHSVFELVELRLKNCAQAADGSYYIPQGNSLELAYTVSSNTGNLPRGAAMGWLNWYTHCLTDDSFNTQVYDTNINNKRISQGAYYVKVNYADGTFSESNKVDALKDMVKDEVRNITLNVNANKTIQSIDVVFVYELYYEYYNAAWWHSDYSNWRCSTTINFG